MFLSMVPAVLVLATAASDPPGSPAPPDDPSALESLVAAERGFSRLSVEKGMREAFLANLAEDGVIFQPLPVNGRKAWEPRPPSKATLIWEPAFAEIAAAGDLGYTTGPWELRPPAEAQDRPVAHGHFVSVWRRVGGEPWRVVVDLGASHAAAEPGVGSGAFNAGPRHAAAKGDRRRAAEGEIRAVEKRFSAEALKHGLATAIAARAAGDLRFNREGNLPALGPEAARASLAADGARARWTPMAVGASRSGDLGYAYGIRECLGPGNAVADSSVFLDVWRRDALGSWRLAMAVDNPVSARRSRP